MTSSHHLTKKQLTILTLIYHYRFLHIKHLQTFLNYKDKRYIQTLLNDLVAKEYLVQIYDTKNFKATATPAIYYLDKNGIRALRTLPIGTDTERRNRYKESTRSKEFIAHCLFMAHRATDLHTSQEAHVHYDWKMPSEYTTLDETLYPSSYLTKLRPDLYFTKTTPEGVVSYVLEHIHSHLPRAHIRRRIHALLQQTDSEGDDLSPQPTILCVCDTLADLLYVKRRTKDFREETASDVSVRVTLRETIIASGITSPIWEEVT